jgi:type III pantothenate kinase
VLSAQAKYLGGAIAPGMHTGAQALIHRASKLSALNVDFDALPAAHFLGKNTADALRSGIVNAHALMIDAMVERLKEELHLPKEVKTIGTGGVMNSLAPLLNSIQHFDPCLTLKGLMLLAETNFPLNPLKERALSL